MLIKVRSKKTDAVVAALSSTFATPVLAETLADVGPRPGDGETQRIHRSYGCTGLLLRSAKPVATWHDENTNLLLRQYFPRGTDLPGYCQSREETSLFSVRLVCDLAGSDMIESVAKSRRQKVNKQQSSCSVLNRHHLKTNRLRKYPCSMGRTMPHG
jgi:hypothetical protein